MELSDEAIDKFLLLSTSFKDVSGRPHYSIKGYHVYRIEESTWAMANYTIYRSTLREIAREAIKMHARKA